MCVSGVWKTTLFRGRGGSVFPQFSIHQKLAEKCACGWLCVGVLERVFLVVVVVETTSLCRRSSCVHAMSACRSNLNLRATLDTHTSARTHRHRHTHTFFARCTKARTIRSANRDWLWLLQTRYIQLCKSVKKHAKVCTCRAKYYIHTAAYNGTTARTYART